MAGDDLDALRARVHGDPGLAQRLASVSDADAIAAVHQAARDAGLDVATEELERAVEDGRRRWSMRWIR